MTSISGRVKRLTDAEQGTLADADPGACDLYLTARAIESELMTAEERHALSHSERSDRFAEAFALGMRRNTSDDLRRDSLKRISEAERARQMAERGRSTI